MPARFIVLCLLCVTALIAVDARGQIVAGAEQSTLNKILLDQTIWGEDAFAAFSLLDRWKELGVSSVIVFSDRLASGTSLASAAEARERATLMVSSIRRPGAQLQPTFATGYRAAISKRAPALRVDTSQFLEDRSYRVVLMGRDGEFLKKDLKVQTVIDAYGPPEKTTTEVIHFEGERRPAILTHYHYADSAVQFVELDLAPTPGLVNRVVIDVGAASNEIFAR